MHQSLFLAKVREFILEVFWFLDFFGELQTNRKTQYANVATSKVGFFFAQVALSIILNLLMIIPITYYVLVKRRDCLF